MNAIDRSLECTPTSCSQLQEPTSTRPGAPPSSGGARTTADQVLPVFAPYGDTSRVTRRLTSNHFVGRTTELGELVRAARAATDRRPVLVLLGGESGVGKTRLVFELERVLSADGLLVLRGDAVEQDDGELPFAPITSSLRPLVRQRDPVFEELGRGSRAQLAALLPGLDQLDGAADRQDGSGQLRLFEALLELLNLLSDRQPVVLVLEDMHWADRSTRTFVSFLARSMRDERLMAALTYRSDELHRRHPLRPLLSELDRLEHVSRIELEPFSRDELAEVLADILGEPPEEPLVDRLYARSEGNALYIEELLAAGLDGRGGAPRSLRDAFMLRIERLSTEAQRAARTIAVGRRLEQPVIAEVSGIEPEALHEALRDAVSEQVLVPDDCDRLQFRHALLREALYEDLLPGERVELHLALARALERIPAGGHERELELTAAVAGHYAAAGDQPAALRAGVRAALAARAVHAYGEAAEQAERALDLWARVPNAAQELPLDHVELIALAASAHRIAGDRNRAEVLFERALEEIDPETDPRRYARLLDRMSRVQWSLNRASDAIETAERALALLPAEESSAERASLIGWLARMQFLRGKFRHSIEGAEAALAGAEAVGDPHAEGEALNTLGMARIALGDVDDGVRLLRRAIDIAREQDDLQNLGYAYSNLASLLVLAGQTQDALAIAYEGLATVPRRMAQLHDWSMLNVAEMSFVAGDWEATRAHLRPQPAGVGPLPIFRMLVEAEFGLGEGDDELARRRLEEAEPLVASSTEPQYIGWFGALQAELLRRHHELSAARAAVEDALGRLEVCTDDVMRIARVSALGATVEADIAQRARDLRERADERDALARARIHSSRLAAAAQEGGPVERAWQAVGKAELARARGRDNPALWRAAATEWAAIERPYLEALARWREAEACVGAEQRPAAAEAAARALSIARRLGARWLIEDLEALAGRARLRLGDRAAANGGGDLDGAATAQVNEPDDPFGLTPRERQVLELIAEGATNRQIGAALFMAEKTASVHVSRILGKLGVRSRTQAAAVAHRLHLT
jgi:DNA-binding CsgD family transcriptional regulator/tetratricopeptide (TPR) repeat protein